MENNIGHLIQRVQDRWHLLMLEGFLIMVRVHKYGFL